MQSSISARPHRLASYVYVIHVLFFGLFEEAGYPEFISNSKRELEGQLCDLSRGLSSSERLDALKEALLAIQWIEGCLMDTAPEAGPDAAAGTAVTADEVDEELRICVESMELEEVQYMEYANGEGGDRTVGEACAKGEGAERWMHGLSSTGDGAKLVRLVWQRRVKSSIKIRV
ncbi:hypothetical protein KEM55_001810 [Ascosphaera atra]|nr:hypothetical protein KEM55_001810 [Ascosphaera atra]